MAKPGQVVISQNTLERIVGSFKTEPLGEFALKGLKQKLPVYAVTSAAESQGQVARDTMHASAT